MGVMMTIPCEYTEWYLTSEGWIRGNSKVEAITSYKSAPENALAKYEYVKKASDNEDNVECQTYRLWEKGERKEKIAELLAKFGACPTKL